MANISSVHERKDFVITTWQPGESDAHVKAALI